MMKDKRCRCLLIPEPRQEQEMRAGRSVQRIQCGHSQPLPDHLIGPFNCLIPLIKKRFTLHNLVPLIFN